MTKWQVAPVHTFFEKYEDNSYGFLDDNEIGEQTRFNYHRASVPYATGIGKTAKLKYREQASVPYPKPGDMVRYRAKIGLDGRPVVIIWCYLDAYREAARDVRRRRQQARNQPSNARSV